ncbi:hypothetical protein OAS78_14395, partial [Pseudomonadales bacterium]|nr:hypothetical protein [Pseudomonadales bacterium]
DQHRNVISIPVRAWVRHRSSVPHLIVWPTQRNNSVTAENFGGLGQLFSVRIASAQCFSALAASAAATFNRLDRPR